MELDEQGYICPYNDACRCQVANCDFCGWNPGVHERRLEEICTRFGITKEKTEQRCIDAVDLVIKMGNRLEPLVKRQCYPSTIYAAVMQCIAAANTIKTDRITCKKCRFAKYSQEKDIWKCRSKKGLFREVKPDEYCSHGKEPDNEK